MKVIYHRLAARDVRGILAYYEAESGSQLAKRFFADFLRTVAKALENPRHFTPAGEVMRRANLDEFPYHFLYEERPWGIKVTVVRHHRRSPRYGASRQ